MSENRKIARQTAGTVAPRHATAITFDVFAAGDVGDHRHDQKRAEVHNEINHDVKRIALSPSLVSTEAHQHVAGVGDAGVGHRRFKLRWFKAHRLPTVMVSC